MLESIITFFLQILDNVVDIFSNVLDDNNVEGWRILHNVVESLTWFVLLMHYTHFCVGWIKQWQ